MIEKLIINADDYGMCESVTKGILKGLKDGVVTSTTAFMNSEIIAHDLSLLAKTPYGLGVHLNITFGRPLTKGRSFVNEQGYFKKPRDYGEKIIVDEEELYQEWQAQIEKFIKITHHLPDHLDSHHNIHLLYPHIYQRLAQEYHLPARSITYPCVHFTHDLCSLSKLYEILATYEGTLEIMTHPGYSSDQLRALSSLNDDRETELSFWCRDDVKEHLKNKLATYKKSITSF